MVTTPSFKFQANVDPNSSDSQIRGSFGRRTSNPPSQETNFSPAVMSANDLGCAPAKEQQASQTTINRKALDLNIRPRVYAHPRSWARCRVRKRRSRVRHASLPE